MNREEANTGSHCQPEDNEPRPQSDSEHLRVCNMKSGVRWRPRDTADAETGHRTLKLWAGVNLSRRVWGFLFLFRLSVSSVGRDSELRGHRNADAQLENL